ncbi:MAG: class I SAM-dependent methyltransferase, partial [Fimbriiglobus sp.]
MSNPPVPAALVTSAILAPTFRRATFAGPVRRGPTPWVRVVVRPVDLRGGRHLQFTYSDGRRESAKNLLPADAGPALAELLALGFAGVHVSSGPDELDVRTSKKGKVTVGRSAAADTPEAPVAHNRTKDVPLPEGTADPVLEAMGVLDRHGRVRPTMRGKFTQINEFLKHLRHAIADAGLTDLGRPADVLDCGCGASYLTIAAHHYLNDRLGIPARILGIDVNPDVIRASVAKAGRLGEGGPAFACGRIGSAAASADIVIALHACDTATDGALAQAVRANARVVLCAPCCHHHLNDQIRPDGPAAVLRPVLRHGILRERTADLVTDGLRALALRIMGYRTDVVEFVSPEHTARNLLIRAVRGAPVGELAFVAEY